MCWLEQLYWEKVDATEVTFNLIFFFCKVIKLSNKFRYPSEGSLVHLPNFPFTVLSYNNEHYSLHFDNTNMMSLLYPFFKNVTIAKTIFSFFHFFISFLNFFQEFYFVFVFFSQIWNSSFILKFLMKSPKFTFHCILNTAKSCNSRCCLNSLIHDITY